MVRAEKSPATAAQPQHSAPERGMRSSAAPVFVDSRQLAIDQRRVVSTIHTGSYAVAQRQRAAGIADSPRAAAQQQRRDEAFEFALPAKPAGAMHGPAGLPQVLRAGIEALSGLDMSDVQVHANSPEPARINALAFAQGSQIHLGPGQERHLPHEAWHVVQQKQGRVRPNAQLKGSPAVNDESGLEREADAMGARAAALVPGAATAVARPAAAASAAVLQPKMGFELELPVLVDIDGRAVPEKRFLGRYGAEHLELQVDHNGDVEGPTPRPPVEANFWSAKALNPVGAMGGLAPNQIEQLGAYDLPQHWETRVDRDDGVAPAVDTRTGLPATMLDGRRWQRRTDRNRFARPPAASDIGMVNAQIAVLDGLIPRYDAEKRNWEPVRAAALLQQIIAAANTWLLANNAPPSKWHPRQRGRYHRGQAKIQTLHDEAAAHLLFWQLPVNATPPVGLGRQYRAPGAPHPVPQWRAQHPLAGQGTARYASILEIVTRPYAIETPAGMVGLLAAMAEANLLAAAIEGATNNFAHRAQLNAIPNTDIANPLTHVGNDNPGQLRGPQSTDASIQSTFAIDLTQIPALMRSTVAMMAPQQQFGLKHQADRMATFDNPHTVFRAEVEMSRAAIDATATVNAMKAQIGPLAPSFVNLRGLLTLVCQYLRMGRHWQPGGVQVLDKNLTDLLSRTDLAFIYRDAVPAAEKAWLAANPLNLAFMRNELLTRTVRTGATALLNNPTETRPPGGPPQFAITCSTFIDNVFTAAEDGITRHFGGFQQRPVEDIDPLNARPGDAINPTVAQPHRMAPVFEMRNMMPKVVGDRFPRADWVPLVTYMATMIQLLNQRTQAQAVQDRLVHEHLGGPVGPVGLGAAQPPW